MRKSVHVFPAARRDKSPAISPELSVHYEEIARNGYTIIENALDGNTCRCLRDAIPDLYCQQAAEIGGQAILDEMEDDGVIRNPFIYDNAFVDLLLHRQCNELVGAFLGSKFILNLQRVVLNRPGKTHATAVWHRDHSYQNFTTSEPVSFSIIFQIDGSNVDNGGLQVLPGSQLFGAFPSDEYVLQNAVSLICDPGAVIILDSATYHSGGQNITQQTRHSVVQIFTMPLIRQNTDLPRQLDGRFTDDKEIARLMGYENPLPQSDLEYRKTRLSRYRSEG